MSLHGLRGYYGTTDLIGGPPRAGASATSATTTWRAVRQQMVTVLKALTPSSLAADKYRVTETEQADFSGYAEAADYRVLREYEIDMISEEFDGVQNYQEELRVVAAELTMAYPHHWAAYQTKDTTNTWNERALRSLANEDRNIIDKAIGIRGGANYVAGQRRCAVGASDFDELDGVTLMVLPLEVMYFHSSS